MTTVLQFPEIDFDYWSNKNDYFSDKKLSETIKLGLNYAIKGRLIGPILESINLTSNRMLVDLIAAKIQTYKDISKFTDDELLIIFDLIQGWGGKTGRAPYVKPAEGPTRLSWKPLSQTYRDAIRICFNEDFDYSKLLTSLLKIPGIGESFATKHMFFWSEYGPRREAIPIYDSRIKTLLCLSDRDAVDYHSFYVAMKNTAKVQKLNVGLLERALFAFSQNYFPNSTLIMKSSLKDMTDIGAARILEKKYKEYQLLALSKTKLLTS